MAHHNLRRRTQITPAPVTHTTYQWPPPGYVGPELDFSRPNRRPTGSSIVDATSIREFGRLYHSFKAGQYLLPNDGHEQDRLDLLHRCTALLLLERIHMSPIIYPRNILDIGTSTGIWAKEIAIEHPGAQVIGTDLSRIQPVSDMPAKCILIVEDAENDEWTLNRQFDLIFMRHMVTSFMNWDKIFDKITAHVAPEGWVELHEAVLDIQSPDGTANGSAIQRWNWYIAEALRRAGRDPFVATRYKWFLQQRGFNVNERNIQRCRRRLVRYPRDMAQWFAC